MTRASISRLGLAAAAFTVLAAAACNQATTTPPQSLTLDRPVDASFACFGTVRITGGGRMGTTSDPVTSQGAPLTDCDGFAAASGTSPPDNTLRVLGQEDFSMQDPTAPEPSVDYYAFFAQPAAGTLAVATWQPVTAAAMSGTNMHILDLDPLTPGAAGVSVGDFPIGSVTDRNGCFELTANAGTCDLTTVSIGSVLSTPPNPQIDRLDVTNASGAKILARPAAMLAEPQSGTVGVTCPATPQGVMYVAYPDCHRVAAIDMSTGQAVASVLFADSGTAVTATVTDGNFTCPAQCGASDPIVDGPRPTSIDLVDDPRVDGSKAAPTQRLAIGLENRSTLTVVDLDATNRLTSFSAVTQVALEGSIGITDVALSPQIGMGGAGRSDKDDSTQEGNGPGGQFQFVYGVATDGTVRVADFLNVKSECDTNIDPRYLMQGTGNAFIHFLSCMSTATLPPGMTALPPRRAGSTGPGIELVDPARPLSVAIVHGVPPPLNSNNGSTPAAPPAAPDQWDGYFAAITATTGAVYIANVDDDIYPDVNDPTKPISVTMQLAMAHQLRDRIAGRDNIANNGATPVAMPVCNESGTADPNSTTVTDLADGPHMYPTDQTPGHPIEQIAANTAISPNKIFQLPSIRQQLCTGADTTMPVSELSFTATPDLRQSSFPDLRALNNDEVWSITWEGPLSEDTQGNFVNGPIVRTGQVVVDGTGMRVQEADHPYCAMGVQPYDQVALAGCDPTATNACGLGQTCYVHPLSRTGEGSCLPTAEVDALSDACKEFLISSRKYAVTDAKSGELTLTPRRTVLPMTPLDGCTGADQCAMLEDAQYRLVHSQNPNADTSPLDPQTEPIHAWACEADPSRPGAPQCVMSCKTDDDCSAGSVCDGGSGRCVEGAIPPLQCVSALQRYEVDAGRAFVVVGSRSGYLHSVIQGANDECVVDPNASPLQTGRIPLTGLPPCPATDDVTTISPNPCTTSVTQVDSEPVFSDLTTCAQDASSPQIKSRPTSAIRFRNPGMTFELVDPVYSGDAMCIGDRGGNLNAPLVFPGYQLDLRIVSGFLPYLLQLAPTGLTGTVMPLRVRRGPLESIWVVDAGDFLSQNVASTRGSVWRVESVDPLIVTTIQ